MRNLALFAEAVPTWIETAFGDVRWRAEYCDGSYIAVWNGHPETGYLPVIDSCRKALSISRRHHSWTVRQHVRVAAGGPRIAMPFTYGHILSALVIHKMSKAKYREPIVEAYVVAGSVKDGKPTVADSIGLAMRVVLSFHDVIELVVNTLVWAVTISSDGSHRISRVLPRGLAPVATELPDMPPRTVLRTCEGLDVQREDGSRQDLLEAALYSKPPPPKPRRRRSKKLFNGVYPVRV